MAVPYRWYMASSSVSSVRLRLVRRWVRWHQCKPTESEKLSQLSLITLHDRSPTSGGQYHWVAQLAPRKYSILLGWYTGKTSMKVVPYNLLTHRRMGLSSCMAGCYSGTSVPRRDSDSGSPGPKRRHICL